MSIDLAVPCGLILNELIFNALKHGVPRSGGEIELTLARRADDTCLLAVNDRGAGIPQELYINNLKHKCASCSIIVAVRSTANSSTMRLALRYI